jgi:hypothetical protein
MTVKELIQELLECDMEGEVFMKIKLKDTDLEYEEGEAGVEIIKTGGGWGKNTAYLTLNLEDTTSQQFVDEIV